MSTPKGAPGLPPRLRRRRCRAVVEYERALKLDPNLSSAWTGLALALDYDAESRQDVEALLAEKQRALEAAHRAVATGPQDGEAYAVRAFLRGLQRHEWARPGRTSRRRWPWVRTVPTPISPWRSCWACRAASGRRAPRRSARRVQLLHHADWLLRERNWQFDRGRSAFEKVLEIAPNHSSASGFLRRPTCSRGDPSRRSPGQPGRADRRPCGSRRSPLPSTRWGTPPRPSARLTTSSRASHMPGPSRSRRCARGAATWIAPSSGSTGRTSARTWASSHDLQPPASIRGDPRYNAFLRRLNLAKN